MTSLRLIFGPSLMMWGFSMMPRSHPDTHLLAKHLDAWAKESRDGTRNVESQLADAQARVHELEREVAHLRSVISAASADLAFALAKGAKL